MTAEAVQLIGLDFGTTTSSAVFASARLIRGAVGRFEFTEFQECFRSEMVFTPLSEGDLIDEEAVLRLLDDWLTAGRRADLPLFGGGALLTGLTAQKANADKLAELIRSRLDNALIASASDPLLESWLAFMGSAAALSRSLPDQPVVNLDIGGGTTNIALGLNGEVLATGCLFVGARHVQVTPGGYRIERLSPHGKHLFKELAIDRQPGAELALDEVTKIVTALVDCMQATLAGTTTPLHRFLQQVPYRPSVTEKPIVTLSGGVGELVYAHLDGVPWPSTTQFGDLGIDLARRIVELEAWSDDLRRHRPQSGGRATVYGLLRHSTEISGSTLFLPEASLLPLTDVMILGSVNRTTGEPHIRQLLELAKHVGIAVGLRVALGSHEAAAVAELGGRLARLLREVSFPAQQPLVLLMQENLGKTLGHYVTEWGRLPISLMVIDEVSNRDGNCVQIGVPHGSVVPVSFYRLAPDEPQHGNGDVS